MRTGAMLNGACDNSTARAQTGSNIPYTDTDIQQHNMDKNSMFHNQACRVRYYHRLMGTAGGQYL